MIQRSEVIRNNSKYSYRALFGFLLASSCLMGSNDLLAMKNEIPAEVSSPQELSQRQLVPISQPSDALLVQNSELGCLGADWHDLRYAFFNDLSNGGRAEFDGLLSSRSLHPVCQFVAENIFSHVLESSDRSKLLADANFFKSTKNLINPSMRDEGGYINKQMLMDLILLRIDGLVPESVENSILAGMSRVIDARTSTLEKKEEWEQFKIDCDEKLLAAKTSAEIEVLNLQVKRLKTLYELDEMEKRNSLRHIEFMQRLEVAEHAQKFIDQRDRDKLGLAKDKWELEKDKLKVAAEERERERQKIFLTIKESLGLATEVVGGVVRLFRP